MSNWGTHWGTPSLFYSSWKPPRSSKEAPVLLKPASYCRLRIKVTTCSSQSQTVTNPQTCVASVYNTWPSLDSQRNLLRENQLNQRYQRHSKTKEHGRNFVDTVVMVHLPYNVEFELAQRQLTGIWCTRIDVHTVKHLARFVGAW